MMFNICHEIFYFCKYEILGKIVFSRFPGKSGKFFPGNGNSREQALTQAVPSEVIHINTYK